MTWWEDIVGFVEGQRDMKRVEDLLWNAPNLAEFDLIWNGLNENQKSYSMAKSAYEIRHPALEKHPNGADDLISGLFEEILTKWLKMIESYDMKDSTKAKQNLSQLSADVMKIAAGTAAIDYTMGLLPNGEGVVSATNTKQMLAWLGVGAVVTAIAHDPVKIGLLRPYQDQLEATFRNRRPDSGDLFLAYQQRSLSESKVEDNEKIPAGGELRNLTGKKIRFYDMGKLTDTDMNAIEGENEIFYDTEISKWGFSEYFSNALKDASTKTLSFGNLMALAKQGRLNRGMAIYSLWGYGLDRKLMKIALESLDQANETANYEGFRAQIEPAYIEGAIDEASLRDYWKKLHIPQDVQDLMMPRFRKKREVYLLKAASSTTTKERDLTVSQLQSAYQNQLMDRAHAQNAILTLGYSLDEARILLDLAEMRRKLPSAQTLKRLTLTDYEKAQKNGLITLEAVLDRMKGEYAPEDIELERQLLKIGKA
jgi:hypothetical protein